MATARQTIQRALRLLRVLDKSETPDSDDAANGLIALNNLIRVGKHHNAWRAGVVDSSFTLDAEIPSAQFLIKAAAGLTVTLPEMPYDGARIQIIQATGSLSSNPLTINPNGLSFNSSSSNASITAAARYMFRADTGNWAALADLAIDDNLPYPTDHDDDWAFVLARRLMTEQGMAADPAVVKFVVDGAEYGFDCLCARYKRPVKPRHELSVIGMPSAYWLTSVTEAAETFENA